MSELDVEAQATRIAELEAMVDADTQEMASTLKFADDRVKRAEASAERYKALAANAGIMLDYIENHFPDAFDEAERHLVALNDTKSEAKP